MHIIFNMYVYTINRKEGTYDRKKRIRKHFRILHYIIIKKVAVQNTDVRNMQHDRPYRADMSM